MPHVRTGDFDCWYADDCFAPPWLTPTTVLIQAGFGRNGEYWRGWVPDLARDREQARALEAAALAALETRQDRDHAPHGLGDAARDVEAIDDGFEEAIRRVDAIARAGARFLERLGE